MLTLTPASSGDQAINVILFLSMSSAWYVFRAELSNQPGTLSASKIVFEVVDSVSGTLAHSTLARL
jgi:hypothetical protein